ncbi:ABC transporter ATP-binding protein [Arenibaculum pallidiluteum]|uniref:ABC transporter ATP-binding protein n=1 Tax=Arenibaculum pallidiluteum TaxID=2812559 RepID=UPI001A97B782|nr:ABC transporter ATP-binding protein [Arenibaculum pallidiluteum]
MTPALSDASSTVFRDPPLLELRGATRRFGGILALNDVSLSIGKGEVVGLIGPNGAGKTTFVNVVSGLVRPDAGQVLLEGRRIDGLPADRIARGGIARTFQVVQPFPRMSAIDNVAVGAMFAGGIGDPAAARHEARELLAFVGLESVQDRPAAALTLADRKRLEFAKSLAMKPRFLMLDEVNAGLNAAELDSALELVARVAGTGITILLIEHLMKVVRRACPRTVVLHQGRVLADGPTAEILADPRVVDAYLGVRDRARRPGIEPRRDLA